MCIRDSSSIQFAWDDSRKEDKSALDKIVIDRSVAVSIGYSFPPLNREFDQKIISKIGKLYIQCLEKDYPFIEARVKALNGNLKICLLYTSDAADDRSSVDLGGRRIIKKKKNKK